MIKIVVDAGHGLNTAGKQTPDGKKEWFFNNVVATSLVSELSKYQNVKTLRVDDVTGKTDISLKNRVDKANKWKPSLYVSCHHNAFKGRWGNHTGTETYIYNGKIHNKESPKIAKIVHKEVVKAMGLRDRGVKKANFYVLRETKGYPAILVEGGFMDSTIDIKVLNDKNKLKEQGKAIAKAIAKYYKLRKKKVSTNKELFKVQVGAFTQKSNAEKLLKELKSKGFDGFIKKE